MTMQPCLKHCFFLQYLIPVFLFCSPVWAHPTNSSCHGIGGNEHLAQFNTQCTWMHHFLAYEPEYHKGPHDGWHQLKQACRTYFNALTMDEQVDLNHQHRPKPLGDMSVSADDFNTQPTLGTYYYQVNH